MYARSPLVFPRRVAVSKIARTFDGIRRWANLVLALAQAATAFRCFSLGRAFNEAAYLRLGPASVSARYELVAGAAIAVGCVAYGFYQFRPARRTDAVLRRVGFFTASGFLGCCVWLIAESSGRASVRGPLICWIVASLFCAFMQFWKVRGVAAEFRWCVVAPISFYAGWMSVEAVTAAAHSYQVVLRHTMFAEIPASIALLASSALLTVAVLRRSAGNPFYAAAIAWALIGIGVRSHSEPGGTARAHLVWVCLAVFVALDAYLVFRSGRDADDREGDEF